MCFYAKKHFPHLQAYSDGPPDFPGPVLLEQEKKKGRNKRAPKGGDKPASRYKKRKKEGDERQLMHSGPDTVLTQIKQVGWISSTHNLPFVECVEAAARHIFGNKGRSKDYSPECEYRIPSFQY